MSQSHQHHAHTSEAGHDSHDNHHGQLPHVDLKGYLIGFVLSVVLTAIPFWLVMHKTFGKSSTTSLILLALAAVQIVVHMVYFLHINTHVEEGWSMLALLFTVVLVVITLSGSLWVMYHLDHNMMPGMMPGSSSPPTSADMRNMP